MDLVERTVRGEQRAAARLMRLLDDRDPEGTEALALLYPHTGRARVVGVTGSPGAGKSTLIDGMIQAYRQDGRTVGVVAIDPTSPFTGGAILGDRVRMQRHATDRGVFIRSLATRGRLGGLSASTGKVVMVLDAMGFDRVVIETVGVGQDEVDVVRYADVTVVVAAPGQGDEVQAHKAGVLEIADVLVVNKADLPGAERTVQDLLAAVDMAPAGSRRPQVMRAVGSKATGVRELCDEVERLLGKGGRDGADVRARARARQQVADLAMEQVEARLRTALENDPETRAAIDRVHGRTEDPFTAARTLLAAIEKTG